METSEGKQSIAITRDVSSGGFLLLSRRRHVVGDTIKLMVRVKDEDHHLVGRVVREEKLGPDESTVWRTKVAIAVDNESVMQTLVTALSGT
jgi:hypothetical protein